jgi:hypothetical protein
MKKALIFCTLLFAFAFSSLGLAGQNFIGLHKDVIREKVRNDLTGFVFTKEIENGDRSFIKFENTFEEQTLLFVLNAQGICTSVSRMYNTWLFNRIKSDLDSRLEPAGELRWIEKYEGKDFEVFLRKGEWFITVATLPLNNK